MNNAMSIAESPRTLTNLQRVVAALLTPVFLLCIQGCEKKPRPLKIPVETGLTGGTLIFEESFEKELGAWNVTGQNWKIVEGRLYSGDRPNNNAGIWLKTAQLPKNARIEFEATSVRGNNPEFVGDMKFEFGGKDNQHASGYIIIFGGWNNTINTIARGDEHGEGRLVVDSTRKVEEGKTYRFQVVRLENDIKWFLDGKLFLRVTDPEVAAGPDFGFNNWNSRFYVDNLKIFEL